MPDADRAASFRLQNLYFSYETQRPSISHSYGIVGTSWPLDSLGMTMAAITSQDLSRRQVPGRSSAAIEREGERPAIAPADEAATVTAQFRPLDPGIVNEAIPAFFIGRNMEGFWVARDVHGQIGGIFLLENSAVSFAKRNSQPAGCATIFPSERFELDLENKGNPLVGYLGSLMRLTMSPRQRIAALIGKMTKGSTAG